jgi:tRNA dimethylallyltransferase
LSKNSEIVMILGPTASGKTRLAVAVAKAINAEIISADSRQVYQDMDIGTGKDLAEYQGIEHHLINILPAGSQYNVAMFQHDFELALSKIQAKNKAAIVCGGTGMYLQSILENYQYTAVPQNPALRQQLQNMDNHELQLLYQNLPQTSHNNIAKTESRKRLIRAIEINKNTYTQQGISTKATAKSFQIFGLNPPLEQRRHKINHRLHERLKQGLVPEIQGLIHKGITPDTLIYYGLEYKFGCQYLQGMYSFEVFEQKLQTAIHQYAKRQMTYFRKMEKDGHHIHWLSSSQSTQSQVKEILETINSAKH